MKFSRSGLTINSIALVAVAKPIFFCGSAAVNELDPAHTAVNPAELNVSLGKTTLRLVLGLPETIWGSAVPASDDAAHLYGHKLVVDGDLIAGGCVN